MQAPLVVQVCGVQNYASRFRKLSLDLKVLQLTIHNRGDIRNDQEDNSTRSFRKAGYRQYVLHCYGYTVLQKEQTEGMPFMCHENYSRALSLSDQCLHGV